MAAKKPRHSREAGFTLIEITFAVLILAGSLVTLPALQTSTIDRSVHDHNTQRAMLAARQILASIEATDGDIKVGTQTGTIDDVRSQFVTLPPRDPEAAPTDQDLIATLAIDLWGVPNVADDAMKRIRLSVSWSDAPLDQLEVFYFVPND